MAIQMTLWAAFSAIAAAVLMLASCSFYHHEFKIVPPTGHPYELYVVQSDDFGTLWSVPTAQRVLGRVAELSDRQNVTVVVFIHGWHHNADPEDPNYQDFEKRLAAINERLNAPQVQAARGKSTTEPTTKVVGIYIGWRGRALYKDLDYLTMWWRKDAAERVGDGDVREFVLRLQRQYLRVNSIHQDSKAPRPHMGLITFGHSFGAQVLIKTLSTTLERSLTERTDFQADLIQQESIPHSPPVRVPIDSFGDINVLINPATEAYQYARIDTLVRQTTYPWCQLPQILVISSDKDTPRSYFFPIARGLTRPFRPAFRNQQQGALWGTALGMLESQKTHVLQVSTDPPSLQDADYGTPAGQQKILRHDFSSRTTFAEVTLSPRGDGPSIASSPALVATEPGTLIQNHNDIFQDRLWEFLIDYVAFLEGKRLLTQELRQQQQVTGGACPDLPTAL